MLSDSLPNYDYYLKLNASLNWTSVDRVTTGLDPHAAPKIQPLPHRQRRDAFRFIPSLNLRS